MSQHPKAILVSVTPSRPCPVCGGNHKCSRGNDGLILCGRPPGPVAGFRFLGHARGDPQFGLYRADEDPESREPRRRPHPPRPSRRSTGRPSPASTTAL
jgi:hypothetical protein